MVSYWGMVTRLFIAILVVSMNKNIKILFADGSWVDFEKPDGFDMATFIHGIRSVGFVLAPGFYAPLGMIKGIIDMTNAQAAVYGTAGPPTANAPTTETKQ